MNASKFYQSEIAKISNKASEEMIEILERHSEKFESLLETTAVVRFSAWLEVDDNGNPCIRVGGGSPFMYSDQTLEDFIDVSKEHENVEELIVMVDSMIEKLVNLKRDLESE